MAPTRLSMNTTSRGYAVGGLLAAGVAAATATIWTTVPSSVLVNAETVGILRGLLIGFWVAAGGCANGLAGAGGIGKVMGEWIVDGRPEWDVWPLDVRRFGRQYRSQAYTLARS